MAVSAGKIWRYVAQRGEETLSLLRSSPSSLISARFVAVALLVACAMRAAARASRAQRRVLWALGLAVSASSGARLALLAARAFLRARRRRHRPDHCATRSQSVEVELAGGQGRVRGVAIDGVASFLAIPYAAPPTGRDRYAAPRAAEPWSATRCCCEQPPMAPQVTPGLPFLLGHPVAGVVDEAVRLVADAKWKSESCLFLNVFAPHATGAVMGTTETATSGGASLCPVMFFIHGGAYIGGAASDGFYSGVHLARQEDVVVVVIQYRLGAFGFLHIDLEADPGAQGTANLGLQDQRFALEWVQTHAASFGGDPSNVTIFGESAGAMSCGALLAMPTARGLFRRAILQSGAASTSLTVKQARMSTAAFAAELRLRGHLLDEGTTTTLEPSELWRCVTRDALRRVPARAILAASIASFEAQDIADARFAMAFSPVVDGGVLPRAPIEAFRVRDPTTPLGDPACVDALMLGVTAHEWRLFFMIPTFGPPWTREVAVRNVAKGIRQFAPYVEMETGGGRVVHRRVSLSSPPPVAACERAAALLLDGLEAIMARERERDLTLSSNESAAPPTLRNLFGRAVDGMMFFQPMAHAADAAVATAQARTYCYRVAYTSRRDAASGAHHAIDLGLCFGSFRNHEIAATYGADPERDGTAELSRRVMAAWGSFARDGVPRLPAAATSDNGGAARRSLEWPAWKQGGGGGAVVMELNTPTMGGRRGGEGGSSEGCGLRLFESPAETALWRAVWSECAQLAAAM